MSKNKNNGKDIVYSLTKEEATMLKKPRYNPYQTGHGVHGETKYSRTKEKRKFLSEIRED